MTAEGKTASSSTSHRRLAVGALAGGLVNIIKVALQLVLLPVMARLLGPSEFGLYALALPTVSLVTLLADGGLGATLSREQETNSLLWSSAFWALLLMGVTLALGSSAFGILIGYLADQPRLPSMIALLSLSLVFLTLSVVPGSRLVRRKHLGVMAFADLASNIVGTIIAVIMAWFGAGAWSLAAQYVAVFAIRAIIVNLAAFHLPAARFSLAVLRPHLISGGILIVSRIFEFTGKATENFLINRIFGTAVVGHYNFSNQVSKFVSDAASNVTWGAIYVQALTEDRNKVVILPSPTLPTAWRRTVSHRVSCRRGGARVDVLDARSEMGRFSLPAQDLPAAVCAVGDLHANRTPFAGLWPLRHSALVHDRT